MEEYNITISVSKDALVSYEHALENLKLALDDFAEAAKDFVAGTDSDNNIVDAIDAVRRARSEKVRAAAVLVDEAIASHRHPMPCGKNRAERARDGAEAIRAREGAEAARYRRIKRFDLDSVKLEA